ncbi:hypothetical protein C2845_PM05G21570 [Panicum miliaceum]|uniref:Uncharacterized protein n=1 Tax=Panicum miliaceum TaxID=4540 RepID=A0A3L6T3M2_PANMI|nr:hypothetical protein C2845_PM05G21570 [Panicum miliaceum]
MASFSQRKCRRSPEYAVMLGRRNIACDRHGVVLSRSPVSDIRSLISSSIDMVSASTS